MEREKSFEVRSLVFSSSAGMHCIQEIFPSERSVNTAPSVHSVFGWSTVKQYCATREEAEQKAAHLFRAVGATDFKARASAVVSPPEWSGVPETDATILDFKE
jgi:hypothetical protein